MSRSPADIRHDLTRATATLADLTALRAHLARGVEMFSELATHPEDEAAIWSVRARLDGPTGHALDDLDALISREQARIPVAQAEVAALDAAEDAS